MVVCYEKNLSVGRGASNRAKVGKKKGVSSYGKKKNSPTSEPKREPRYNLKTEIKTGILNTKRTQRTNYNPKGENNQENGMNEKY